MWNQKWVIGNWKMNGQLQFNQDLINQFNQLEKQEKVCIGIAPPHPYLSQIHHLLQNIHTNPIHTCAQDVSRFAENGAYTGEVSAQMLQDIGTKIVIIGHSERHQYFNENNEIIRTKIENTLHAGLIPLLCVGENLQEREAGQEQQVVAHQLDVLKGLPTHQIAVAYEPVWAIGTGKVATTKQIAQMHAFIYQQILSLLGNTVTIRLLYGGSVKADNATEIFQVAHVDGALVGGASLNYNSFSAIIQAAQQA